MGIYIKGLKMPNNCEACQFWEGEVNGCPITHYFTIRRKGVDRPEWCPLLHVPDHGDLIDRDEVADDACLIWGRNSSGDDAAQEIIEHLRKMKAVIPAERSEASLCDNCDEKNENCSWCKRMERSEE